MLTTGQRIRKLRKNNGYTQERLAELVDVALMTVVRWEADRRIPYGEKLYRLSKVFGVSMNYILKGERISDDTGSENTD
jgi:transcriptional regulator with XRE-family HTH domain